MCSGGVSRNSAIEDAYQARKADTFVESAEFSTPSIARAAFKGQGRTRQCSRKRALWLIVGN